MVILAVDDEKIALEGLVSTITQVAPEATVYAFSQAQEALRFAKDKHCDVAFLDIRLRGSSGMELAYRLTQRQPEMNIIFTTGYGEYAGEAFSLHASGYLRKPITPEKVRQELVNLRHPLAEAFHARMRVRAFGNFEVYVEEKPLPFRYSKTRELFAYLVDRNGDLCSNRELIEVLWEEEGGPAKSSYFQNLRKDLITTLRAAGCLEVLIRQPGRMGVRPECIDCDYYDWLAGRESGLNAYNGMYMTQYAWSEFTLGSMENE